MKSKKGDTGSSGNAREWEKKKKVFRGWKRHQRRKTHWVNITSQINLSRGKIFFFPHHYPTKSISLITWRSSQAALTIENLKSRGKDNFTIRGTCLCDSHHLSSHKLRNHTQMMLKYLVGNHKLSFSSQSHFYRWVPSIWRLNRAWKSRALKNVTFLAWSETTTTSTT